MISYRHTAQPLLALRPVSLNLADGNNIPPPAPDTPPLTPPGDFAAPKAIPNTYGGPLSSHPVTPNDSDEAIAYFPPMARSTSRVSVFPDFPSATSRSSSSAHTNRPHPVADVRSSGRSEAYKLPKAQAMSNIHVETKQKQDHTSRRPSVAERFLRLRSLSSLRGAPTGSKNASTSSLAPSSHTNLRKEYNLSDSSTSFSSRQSVAEPRSYPLGTVNEQSRGLKRSRPDTSVSPPSNRSTLRRKSMDLLNSAKRASGLWNHEMLKPEYAAGENYNMSFESSTAPQVQLKAVDLRLGADDMFSAIGR